MINIQRPDQIPASLGSPVVRNFLEKLAEYHDEPDKHPEPAKPSEYRNSDVLRAFDQYFFKKCYLTEQGFGSSWAMDVDHFICYVERKDLVFEWTNLYPAEHRANMMKPRKTPEGGYLDPCSPDDDVETEVWYTLAGHGKEPRFRARSSTNRKAMNTAELLSRLHNGHQGNEDSHRQTKHLRNLIKERYDVLMKAIVRWRGENDEYKRFQAEEELKLLLSRKASFTMLMRSIEEVQAYVPAEFLD